MKHTSFLLVLFVLTANTINAQIEDAWVFFNDKPDATYYLNNPLEMLTQRSLDRRERQGIQLNEKDVPLHSAYVASIANVNGIIVLARSKWMNALHVRGTQSVINGLMSLTGVNHIEYANKNLETQSNKKTIKRSDKFKEEQVSTIRQNAVTLSSDNQIEMLRGDFLHNNQFEGEAIHMAILDAGFNGVETFDAFSLLHDDDLSNGEVLGGYNFVGRNSNFYANVGSTHGLAVLSTIAATVGNTFRGTAPKAKFYLFVTEDAPNESPLEESLWVEAAERADSLGVDVINTSLGYTTFDDSTYDYNYFDMNGETTFISRGAELASQTGMFLVNAAGNSGTDSWRYIGAPADAVWVLSVGAVNATENTANFSSFGPSADNRIKPEVLAQGQGTVLINGSNGNVGTSNGTSFASPIMAGLVACLWEAFPYASMQELRSAIVNSSDSFDTPTVQRGYGLPNFEIAHGLMSNLSTNTVHLTSNIVDSELPIKFSSKVKACKVSIYDSMGVLEMRTSVTKEDPVIDVTGCTPGVYLVIFTTNKGQDTYRFLKQ